MAEFIYPQAAPLDLGRTLATAATLKHMQAQDQMLPLQASLYEAEARSKGLDADTKQREYDYQKGLADSFKPGGQNGAPLATATPSGSTPPLGNLVMADSGTTPQAPLAAAAGEQAAPSSPMSDLAAMNRMSFQYAMSQGRQDKAKAILEQVNKEADELRKTNPIAAAEHLSASMGRKITYLGQAADWDIFKDDATGAHVRANRITGEQHVITGSDPTLGLNGDTQNAYTLAAGGPKALAAPGMAIAAGNAPAGGGQAGGTPDMGNVYSIAQRLKQAGANQTTVNMPPQEASYQANMGTLGAKDYYENIKPAGETAVKRLNGLNALQNLSVETGPLTERIKNLTALVEQTMGKGAAAAMGITPSTDAATFEKISNGLVMGKMQGMKNIRNGYEFNTIKDSMPYLNTPDAAKDTVINLEKADASFDRDKMRFYQDWSKTHKDAQGADSAWEDRMGSAPLVAKNPAFDPKQPAKGNNTPVLTYYQWKDAMKKRNPSATEDQLLDTWKANYAQ